ncbi:MAG: hypothetical protein A3E01_18780 [Gammaproteobacteria bacterium RIFCSPHIGHO2_12_FULL_63_22]|nr:MAG: hypothetical protein A3E01_18780 [Gammaproteobacteria bacterium RIFCSPHIGHO2_12_FULL_63_22]
MEDVPDALPGALPGALPSPGDIVWCHFPNANPKDKTMKERPALVLSVMDETDPPRLRVAYGTTQKPRPVGRGQFLISRPAHLLQAGLADETRFSLTNVVVLDYTEHWFYPAPLAGGLRAATPKMGVLPAECMKDLERAAGEARLIPKK